MLPRISNTLLIVIVVLVFALLVIIAALWFKFRGNKTNKVRSAEAGALCMATHLHGEHEKLARKRLEEQMRETKGKGMMKVVPGVVVQQGRAIQAAAGAETDSDRRFTESSQEVFLGGSCNPTTWRKDIAIPTLEKAGVKTYNPQVDDWSPDLAEVEAKVKERCWILLFVIDKMTAATASILECTEYIVKGRRMVLVIDGEFQDGDKIAGTPVSKREMKDLNRMR